MRSSNLSTLFTGLLFALAASLFSGSAMALNAGTGKCGVLSPGKTLCSINGRNYELYVPDSYSGDNAVPLVVDMHGYTSNYLQQLFVSGWNDLADKEGFVVAYPQGEWLSWNAQGSCCGLSTADEVGFIREMVASIQSAGNIDDSRVFATGISNGGSMTHTLACEAADIFAGAAAVAYGISGGRTFDSIVSKCTPSKGIPVIHFHGTNDLLVNYKYGARDSLGAEDSLEAWREVQSCETSSSFKQVSRNTSCQTHSNCSGGAQVSMCTVQGGGHILYPYVDGPGIPSFAWDFFQNGL